MRFKKPKKEILKELMAVYPYANFSYSNMADMSPNQLKGEIERYTKEAIRAGLQQAMTILMDNIYSEEEFEKDIGLTK